MSWSNFTSMLLKEREICYISGKYSSSTSEETQGYVDHANDAGIRLLREGRVPIIPHVNFHFFPKDITYKQFMLADIEIMKRCDSLYMLNNFEDSRGAKIELWLAKRWNKKIEYEELP